jgi:hypothetical protein
MKNYEMLNYEMLNRLIKNMGFDRMTLKCHNDGSISFVTDVTLSRNTTIEYTLYVWGNDEEIVEGNDSKNRKTIFKLCRDFKSYDITSITSGINGWKFIEFVSGCNSIEEISLKMQLMGMYDEKL